MTEEKKSFYEIIRSIGFSECYLELIKKITLRIIDILPPSSPIKKTKYLFPLVDYIVSKVQINEFNKDLYLKSGLIDIKRLDNYIHQVDRYMDTRNMFSTIEGNP